MSSKPPTLAYVQRVSTGIIVFLALFTISGCFLDAFLCNPPKYIYDLDFATAADRSNYCFDNSVTYGAYMYQAALLFTTDIMILILPVPAILKLNMSRGRISALVIIFGSGELPKPCSPSLHILSYQPSSSVERR